MVTRLLTAIGGPIVGVLLLWCVFELLERIVRVVRFAPLSCPHCGRSYGWRRALRAKRVVIWDHSGSGSVRRLTCAKCNGSAVFDYRHQRYEMFEDSYDLPPRQRLP